MILIPVFTFSMSLQSDQIFCRRVFELLSKNIIFTRLGLMEAIIPDAASDTQVAPPSERLVELAQINGRASSKQSMGQRLGRGYHNTDMRVSPAVPPGLEVRGHDCVALGHHVRPGGSV